MKKSTISLPWVLQGAVLRFILGEDAAIAGKFLADVGHFLAQDSVLLLQEGCPDSDLVLLQAAGIP